MKPIRAGKYRKRLTIFVLPSTVAVNSYNEADLVNGYVPIARVWGSITPLSGSERFFAEQVQADSVYKIEMRFFKGLTAAHKIGFLDPQLSRWRFFNPININDTEERHYETVAMCHEAGP